MKGLSIEEKAKAYDEALRKAKEALDSLGNNYICNYLTKDDVREIYANLFPVLKESEDEKIRKMIIEIVKKDEERIGVNAHLKKIQWLEKQAEKNYESPLAHEKMETERWKEACKAACSDVNYRSHYGLTETRDDYFVDGVHWADEHPTWKPSGSK